MNKLIRWIYRDQLVHCEESSLANIGIIIEKIDETEILYDKIEILDEWTKNKIK
jgi:hypothetical protein